MKKVGIVSYNIHCNFTNYGSALQSWALSETIKKYGVIPVLIDYCPDVLKDKDALNPFRNMWDKDEESRRMCELSMPAIKTNYYKFDDFYTNRFNRTKKTYYSNSFNEVVNDEELSGFVCGADTIFCVDEFGIDDGYYANYSCMKNGCSVSYAASFGDSHFNEETYKLLDNRLQNFKAIGIRENGMVPYIKERVNVPVSKVIDPTLLLEKEEYEKIITNNNIEDKYLLLYSRRYNKKMFDYAEKVAKEKNLKIVDISLRADMKDKHIMSYDSGVEEFLGLIKNAEFVVTNSYHGMIFAIQFEKEFVIFSREQCDTKIIEVLDMVNLKDRMMITGLENINNLIDYDSVKKTIAIEREKSLNFLKMELSIIRGNENE